MDQIFAPWRIEWVERTDPNDDIDGCVFCTFAEQDRDRDRDRRIVARADAAFVLLNNYPYNPGHVMVIPHAHAGAYQALDDEALLAHARLKQRTFDVLETALEPDGFNAGLNIGGDAAGGSIDDHLHTHVVPRWRGDTNFMPVIGETKVIVEAVDASYERIRAAFAAQAEAEAVGEDRAIELSLA